MRCNVGERLIVTLCSLEQQMIGRSDVVMPVRFDALYGIVRIEAELIEHLLIDGIIQGHGLLLGWEQALRLFVLELSIPRVGPDFLYGIANIWLDLQDLGEEVGAVC